MKPLDFNTLDRIAKSNLSQELTQQTLHNIQTVQVPTLTGFLPKAVVLPIIEDVCKRQTEVQQNEQPPQIPQTAKFYLAVNNEPKGPFTANQIKDFVALGLVNEQTLCWTPGFEEWKAISIVNDLKS